MDISFYYFSDYWYFAVVVFVLGVGLFAVWRKVAKDEKKIFFKENWNKKKVYSITGIKFIFLIVGMVLLLLAVWRPQWGQEKQDIFRKGLDLVFTVDVSKSMNALDFSERGKMISRLDAVKYLVGDFAGKRKSDRVALVEFAGESFVASPLTLDHSVFSNFLENISSDDIGKQGTNLAEALEISISRLEIKNDKERSKVILLFSDGDETINSKVEKMAQLARDKGIVIYTVGVGSEDGMPIPEGQDGWGHIIYKKYHGKKVITKLNPEPLKRIAKITKGRYFHAESISDLKRLQGDLESLPKKILHSTSLTPHTERYWYFELFGLVLFVFGFLLPKNISNTFTGLLRFARKDTIKKYFVKIKKDKKHYEKK